MISQIDVLTNQSTVLANPGFYIVGFICINGSDADVTLTNARGDQWRCAAGQVLAQNPNTVGYTLSAKTTSTATYGQITLMTSDQPVDLAQNTSQRLPPAQTLNANIVNSTVPVQVQGTATINGTVTISGTTAISGNVNSVITSIQAGVVMPVSGTVNAQITGSTITITTQDLLVENNTGILVGLLPSSTVAYTVASNSENTQTFAKAVPGFGLTTIVTGAGRLNLWLVDSTQIITLLRDVLFYNGPSGNAPIEKRYAVPVAANAVLHTRWDDSTSSLTGILRV